MKQYIDLLNHIFNSGADKTDRTGTGTRSVFGYQMRFDLNAGFPLLTTKKLYMRSIIGELLWFLRGDTNINLLEADGRKIKIWDEWADEKGNLGCVYGEQWRSWANYKDRPDGSVEKAEPVDQIADVVKQIKENPDSRRLIVSAWNPARLGEMALPPCHCLFQFYVSGGRLSCQLYQRSADIFLGVPFNIASYSLLTMMIAQVCGLKLGEFIHTFGDAHLYKNHFKQAAEQLNRAPKPLPVMELNPEISDIFAFQYEDFTLKNYDPHPHIKAPIAV